jgi:hypothetical protein
MRLLALRTRMTLATALTIPALVAVWSMTVPGFLSPSTFAVIAGVVVGAAAVTLITWRNAQPTENVAELLHTTEKGS